MADVSNQTEMDELNTEKKKIKFEHILQKIGAYGFAQFILVMFGILVEVSVCYFLNYFMLENVNPGFVCEEVSDGQEEVIFHNASVNQCPGTGYKCVNFTYDDSMTTMVTEWNLVCDKAYFPKLTTSIMFGGVLVGAMLGTLADYVGRKLTVMVAWIGLSIFTMSLALAQSWEVYVALRFIGGVFSGVCACTANTLPMEYVGPKLRVFVAMRNGWRVGYLTLALLGYLIRPWRHLVVACGSIAIIFIPLSIWLVPESARWYIQRGEYEKAMTQVKWVAKLNRRAAPSMEELKQVRDISQETAPGKTYTVLDLFANPKYARKTCTLGFAWFSLSILAYGITSEMSALTGSIYLNLFFSGLFNLLVRVTTLYTLERFGRRIGFPLYTALPTIMCFLIAILDATGVLPEMVRTGLAVASFACLSGAWSAVFAYAQESYPTLLRNTSTSTMNTITRLGGILAPQISYLGVFHSFIPYLIFGSLGILSMTSMLIVMPETKGKPLPEDLPVRSWGRKSSTAKTTANA